MRMRTERGAVCFLSLLFVSFSQAVDQAVKCGACHVIAEEVGLAINSQDPGKTVQVGSFRVDPSGNQKLTQIPYARSDVHLTEVLETVCEKTKDYMQSKSKIGDHPIFIPQNRKDGKPQMVNSVTLNSGSMKSLKYACESLIEDYEDEVIKVFKSTELSPLALLEMICLDVTGACDKDGIYDMAAETAIDPAFEQIVKKSSTAKKNDGGDSDDESEDNDSDEEDTDDDDDDDDDVHEEL